MKWFLILRVLHFIYLGILLIFIFLYFTQYQPVKLHRICAETSAKTVLGLTSGGDPHDHYDKLYRECIRGESFNLLTFFKKY